MDGPARLLIEAERLRGAEIGRAAEQARGHEHPSGPGLLRRLAERYWARGNARNEQPASRPSWGARRM